MDDLIPSSPVVDIADELYDDLFPPQSPHEERACSPSVPIDLEDSPEKRSISDPAGLVGRSPRQDKITDNIPAAASYPTKPAFSLGNMSMGCINDFLDSISPASRVPRVLIPEVVYQRLAGPSQIIDSNNAKLTEFMAMIDL